MLREVSHARGEGDSFYHVLQTSDDPCADDALEEGYRFLQERAGKTSDEGERRPFLENAEEHREMVREYARVGSGVVEDG